MKIPWFIPSLVSCVCGLIVLWIQGSQSNAEYFAYPRTAIMCAVFVVTLLIEGVCEVCIFETWYYQCAIFKKPLIWQRGVGNDIIYTFVLYRYWHNVWDLHSTDEILWDVILWCVVDKQWYSPNTVVTSHYSIPSNFSTSQLNTVYCSHYQKLVLSLARSYTWEQSGTTNNTLFCSTPCFFTVPVLTMLKAAHFKTVYNRIFRFQQQHTPQNVSHLLFFLPFAIYVSYITEVVNQISYTYKWLLLQHYILQTYLQACKWDEHLLKSIRACSGAQGIGLKRSGLL